MKVRQIKPEEISLIKDFPPAEWQLDLSKVYQFHSGESYFYAVVAIIDNVIAGTGMSILTGNTAWLGTIIVKENYRKRGIGTAVTKNLINWSASHGSNKIILVASDLGMPVYKKLGFRTGMYYLAYEGGKIQDTASDHKIKRTVKSDLNEILVLDRKASGENRSRIIEKSYIPGFRYTDNGNITGYYLPDFGRGLIIANNETAGMALLRFRYSENKEKIIIPEPNLPAKIFLEANGFTIKAKYPRMYLGYDAAWRPDMVYLRGSGYLG